jgi:hypothetical protein
VDFPQAFGKDGDVIWAVIPAWLKRALLGAAVALAAIWAAWSTGKQGGAVARDLKAARGNAKAAEAGRKGVAGAKADLRAGKTPEQIVRDNDGDWQ